MLKETPVNIEFDPEINREKINACLAGLANEVNLELLRLKLLSVNDKLVGDDGRLNMRSFEVAKNGPYTKAKNKLLDRATTSIKEDEAIVHHLEDTWAQSDMREKDENESALLEKLIAILLHKFLHDKFLIVRSAKFDDYQNGIDTVIVNKTDGSVVCAFDEVVDDPQGGRTREKMSKLIKLAECGGTQIKYGITFATDPATGEKKLIKKGINNVPVFYLPFPRERLLEVMAVMSGDISAAPSMEERKMFGDVLDILQRQIGILINNPRVNRQVLENLKSFAASLVEMIEISRAA